MLLRSWKANEYKMLYLSSIARIAHGEKYRVLIPKDIAFCCEKAKKQKHQKDT